MHKTNIISAGKELNSDSKVLIMLHGRGATAQDILPLASSLNVKDFTLIAPQATNNTWYPYSFLMPPPENEPWLSSALNMPAPRTSTSAFSSAIRHSESSMSRASAHVLWSN